MDQFEYQIKLINGLFKLRSTKTAEMQSVCTEMGKDGWELVTVTYDWLTVSYHLYFKRKLIGQS
ncbi:hypothetical protein L9G74_09210 [Shewanella sp. C32]|uniref:DUF4177 domain-containing protein n=1 Tax=Shewanella electrica TaxID=515560 RepID=A0ABT2FJV3_9GAMM|nr:hypothetical protein [Shewanella electrica]MCH1924939.1 hypothetical protein [Shewanella electrica]MCS4556616.1 hypothetical protein [Shewanella electrica]